MAALNAKLFRVQLITITLRLSSGVHVANSSSLNPQSPLTFFAGIDRPMTYIKGDSLELRIFCGLLRKY